MRHTDVSVVVHLQRFQIVNVGGLTTGFDMDPGELVSSLDSSRHDLTYLVSELH